jgi:hypothetical protein
VLSLLLALLAPASAEEGAAGAPEAGAPEEEAPPDPDSAPPPLWAPVGRDELIVRGEEEVLRYRAQVFQSLVEEGYRRRIRRGDRTIFLSEDPWKPRVIVHDDGWVYFRREPPRVHAPGRSYADQGSPAAYLLCIIAPTSCVSVGGWLVSPRKLNAVKAELLDTTKDEVRSMNDAVARRELGQRLYADIPRDLEQVWSREDLPASERRALLFEYWDSRTETPEGDAAKEAVASFLRGVVQQSETPFTEAELAALNAKRQSLHPLSLGPRSFGEPPP